MHRLLIPLIITLSLSACANMGLPVAPVKAPQTEFPYRLGAGDLIEVSVWRNPEVSAKVPIRPDGKVTVPLIEDLQAAGKTPSELSREIEKGLARFIREPSVSIIVTQIAETSRDQVRVVGEVSKPTAMPYRSRMTVLDALLAAGGLTKLANGNGAILIRGAEGNKQYRLRVKDLLSSGDVTANAELMPGDVISIPERTF